MFNTDEIYNEAVKNSSIHHKGSKQTSGFILKFIVLVLSLLVGYFGFAYYSSKFMVDETLVIQEEVMVEAKQPKEVPTIQVQQEPVSESIPPKEHKDLALAINDIVNGKDSLDTASYIAKLEEEIALETQSNKAQSIQQEPRVIVVKKGDTLQSIANQYYGNRQAYKRIIASNQTLSNGNNIIYEGQTIILPY